MAYDNPAGLIAMSVILGLLAIFCVVLRFMARRKKHNGLQADDWLILAAVIWSTGMGAMEIYGVSVKALGVPLDATIEDPHAVDGRLNKSKHIELSYLLISVLCLGLIKLSVAFLYRRIFVKPVFRRVLNVWIAILIAYTVAFEIAGLTECGRYLKDSFTPQGYLDHCGDAIPTGWALVGSGVATDLITIVLPLPMFWSLQLPTIRKIQLASVFLVALFSLGVSIAKAYIYIKASLGLYHEDAILTLTAISVWTYVEVQVGTMVACAPSFRCMLPSVASTKRLVYSARNFFIGSGSRTGKSSSGRDDSESDQVSDHTLVPHGLGENKASASRVDVYDMHDKTPVTLEMDEIHVERQLGVEIS